MARITTTEAARAFSDVLNRVAAGEEIEITHNGAPVAIVAPPRSWLVSAERFREILASAPPSDVDFAEDVRALRAGVAPPVEARPT